MREVVMKKFLNHHWTQLSKIRVPWFMPEWIGGLGLPSIISPDDDVDVAARTFVHGFGPTSLDLKKGANIVLNWQRKPPMKDIPAPSWKVHQLVMQSLPCKPIVTSHDVDTGEYDRLYALLTVEALFRQDLDGLRDKNPLERSIRVLRHNERLWSSTKPLARSLALADLTPRKVNRFIPCKIFSSSITS
jgi:hypothetical protein